MLLSRAQFLQLTDLTADALKVRDQRGQLPFVIDQSKFGRGYTPFEALLTILVSEFAEGGGLGVSSATDLVARLSPGLADQWHRIAASSDAVLDGSPLEGEILCGAFEAQGPKGKSVAVEICGTADDVAAAWQKNRPFRTSPFVSVTRAGIVLNQRAKRHSISIPEEFWEGAPSYRPRESGPALVESMRKLLQDPNQNGAG